MSDRGDVVAELGVDAYTYLYPLVIMDLTRRQAGRARKASLMQSGPMNTFVHVRELPPADFKGVVRPNFDTLYSLAWLDLTRGPVVVSSAAVTDGRYYELPMYDMWTDQFAVPGGAHHRHRGRELGGRPARDRQATFRRALTASTRPRRTCGSSYAPRPMGHRTTRPYTRSRTVTRSLPLANWGGRAPAGPSRGRMRASTWPPRRCSR